MAFKDVLDGTKSVEVPDDPKKSKGKFKRGCETCTLNIEGCTKVIGLSRITGKEIFVWTQSPGQKEVSFVYKDDDGVKRKGMELVGPPGEWFWREANRVGIDREDCDIQHVVRCRPTIFNHERGYEQDRKPTKEEIKHCSIYTDKAIEKAGGKAKVHIVLGLVAAAALLGREYVKGHTVFWSDKLNAKVICIAHPAYFMRDGYAKSKLQEFRAGMKEAAAIVKGNAGRFEFVMSQDFKAITTVAQFEELAEKLEKTKERVVIDIEDGPRDGGRVMLCCGFCDTPGIARVVYYDKTDVKIESKSKFRAIFHRLFTNPKIRFVAQHGVHDIQEIPKLLGCDIANFDYDTEYAEYLYDSSRRSYSLIEIAEARFQKYAGYKDMIIPHVGIPGEYDGTVDYDKIPEAIMTPYNGADCSLTKEIEIGTSKKINLALLHVYMDASFIFDGMNRTGPLLDFTHYETVEAVLPDKIKRIKQKLALIAGKPNFNPGSTLQVRKLLYEQLELPEIQGKKGKISTDHNALVELSQYHEAPMLLDEYRGLAKMNSTSLVSYRKSAEIYGGQVRTIWWLTGTTTGRLRSGKGSGWSKGKASKKKREGIVNLQNIMNDPLIRNMFVSDVEWRQVLKLLDEDKELAKEVRMAVKKDMEKRATAKDTK